MIRLLSVTAMLLFSVTCGGSPTGPSGAREGTMTAHIDGQPFQASEVRAALRNGGQWLEIIGLEACGTGGPGFQILALRTGSPVTVGTYTVGSADAAVVTLNVNANVPGGAIAWSTQQFAAVGSGTVTVLSLSATRVSGTFAFEIPPMMGNTIGGTKVVTQGVFDVMFSDRRVC